MRWALAVALVLGSVLGILGADVEATLGIVKPDCVSGGRLESIKNQVRASGFTIEAEKQIRLRSPEAEEFYAEHSARGFFRDLVGFMTSGPILVLKLAKQNAVAEWRSLIGPTDALQARASHPERYELSSVFPPFFSFTSFSAAAFVPSSGAMCNGTVSMALIRTLALLANSPSSSEANPQNELTDIQSFDGQCGTD